MSIYAVAAVGVGAALGAWLRWWLDLILNPIFPLLPFGTLLANLVGGYLVGIAVEYSFIMPHYHLRQDYSSSLVFLAD